MCVTTSSIRDITVILDLKRNSRLLCEGSAAQSPHRWIPLTHPAARCCPPPHTHTHFLQITGDYGRCSFAQRDGSVRDFSSLPQILNQLNRWATCGSTPARPSAAGTNSGSLRLPLLPSSPSSVWGTRTEERGIGWMSPPEGMTGRRGEFSPGQQPWLFRLCTMTRSSGSGGNRELGHFLI